MLHTVDNLVDDCADLIMMMATMMMIVAMAMVMVMIDMLTTRC